MFEQLALFPDSAITGPRRVVARSKPEQPAAIETTPAAVQELLPFEEDAA
ncbi:hypothetical protein [Streptomyces amritsarensis]|nr:hypothetical protein [Streptomyces amritsarensis]